MTTVPDWQASSHNLCLLTGECADGRVLYGVAMIIILFLIYAFNSGKDNSINTLMYAVAVDRKLKFTPLQGSLLAMGYYIGYAGGRALYAIIGICIPVQVS